MKRGRGQGQLWAIPTKGKGRWAGEVDKQSVFTSVYVYLPERLRAGRQELCRVCEPECQLAGCELCVCVVGISVSAYE